MKKILTTLLFLCPMWLLSFQAEEPIQNIDQFGGKMGPVPSLMGNFEVDDPWFKADLLPVFLERIDYTARIPLQDQKNLSILAFYGSHEYLTAKVGLAAIDFENKEHRENFMITVPPGEEVLVDISPLVKRGFQVLLLFC